MRHSIETSGVLDEKGEWKLPPPEEKSSHQNARHERRWASGKTSAFQFHDYGMEIRGEALLNLLQFFFFEDLNRVVGKFYFV